MRSDVSRTLNDYVELRADPEFQVVSSHGALFKYKKICDPIEPGASLSKIFKGFWSPEIRNICALALNRGETGKVVQELNRNGAYLALEATAAPYVHEMRVEGVTLFVRDVTMSQRLERQQSLNSKMKTISQLASEIVHKMNNPIAAILNRIGGMLVEDRTDCSAESLRTDLQEIQEQLYSVSLITNALTAFSTETHSDFKLIQANVIIENALNLLMMFEADKTINYQVDLDENLPRILGSEVTLEQSLVNILRNAMDAVPEKDGILIITSGIDHQFKDFIKISISDNGRGIAPENLEQIVDPFFSTKDGNHNGLGLSVSYGIISNHQGSIEISSTPETGTAINILLPIARV